MKSKLLLKSVALLTSVCFLAEQSLYADIPPSAIALKNSKEAQIRSFLPDSLLPPELGKVVDSWGGSPSVILIQDAHGHLEAQIKIQAILKFLHRRKAFSKLFIEGGVGRLDPGLLRFFEDQQLNVEAAEMLTREAEIGGPELFLLDNPGIPAYGTEETKLYVGNLLLFRKVIGRKAQSEGFLRGELEEIRRHSSKVFSPGLKEFFKEWLAYEDFSDTARYLNSLDRAAVKHAQLNLHDAREQLDWPMLVRFFELKSREPKLDPKKAKEEREKLIAWSRQAGLDENLIRQAERSAPDSDLRSFGSPSTAPPALRVLSLKIIPILPCSRDSACLKARSSREHFLRRSAGCAAGSWRSWSAAKRNEKSSGALRIFCF